MKNLDPIQDDPRATFDAIIGNKEEPRLSILNRLRPRVFGAYETYERWQHELHKIPTPLVLVGLREDEQEALRYCYTGATYHANPSKPLDCLYKQVRELTGTCPYCTITITQTLDHYLPQNSYPEYSVLSRNLIPSCYSCNPNRSFRNKRGERALIHPYFDHIPNERLLVATVRVIDHVPEAEFSVDLSNCRDIGFGQLYQRHFVLLKLADRYRSFAMSSYGLPSVISQLRRDHSRGTPREDVRASLAEQADEEEKRLGSNHFRVALYRGAASSDEFLNHCLRRTP